MAGASSNLALLAVIGGSATITAGVILLRLDSRARNLLWGRLAPLRERVARSRLIGDVAVSGPADHSPVRTAPDDRTSEDLPPVS